jgi:glycosyltransferase involved in cell wall biosynthesis
MATTQARRRFLSQAVKYFLRQTYSPKELIVIDDPGEPAFDTMTPAREIRYLQTDARLALGSKLNLGIQETRGTIVQKLDDDDYYHRDFLGTTVAALLAGNRPDSIATATSNLVLIADTGELKWRTRDLFSGGTMCFFKKLWRKRAFRDVKSAEDWLFLKDHQPAIISIENPELYCYVRHSCGHLWSHFLESVQTENGAMAVGGDVTEFFRKLPAYPKRLKECMPKEDIRFYENHVEIPKNQSRSEER